MEGILPTANDGKLWCEKALLSNLGTPYRGNRNVTFY